MKSFFASLDIWEKKHHPDWIDALRIVSAIIIEVRTLLFISNTAYALRFLEAHHAGAGAAIITYATGSVILLGSALIFLGLMTRIASVTLIPFMIISVILSSSFSNGFALTSDLLLSVIILFLLVFYFVEGSGKFSVDRIIQNYRNTLTPDNRA